MDTDPQRRSGQYSIFSNGFLYSVSLATQTTLVIMPAAALTLSKLSSNYVIRFIQVPASFGKGLGRENTFSIKFLPVSTHLRFCKMNNLQAIHLNALTPIEIGNASATNSNSTDFHRKSQLPPLISPLESTLLEGY